MVKKSLKDFNPDKIAEIEAQMWRAYYTHKFFKLFLLLLRMMHELFGLNFLYALEIAYDVASSAISFRLNRGKERQDVILKKLTKLCKHIAKHSIESFDYKKVAELEMKWWFIDRYPDRYNISREEALAETVAELYKIDVSKLREYAEYRAKAMILQDVAEETKTEADWNQVESLLKISFNSLHKNIQG